MITKFTKMLEEQAVPWWVILVEGIVAIAIGILILINPSNALQMFVRLLGVFFIVKGILGIVSIFSDRNVWVYKLLAGLFSIALGLLIFILPVSATGVFRVTTLILIGFGALVISAIDIVKSLTGGGCGLGILGLLIGLLGLIVLGNSAIATEFLPYIFGAVSIIGGGVAVVVAVRSR